MSCCRRSWRWPTCLPARSPPNDGPAGASPSMICSCWPGICSPASRRARESETQLIYLLVDEFQDTDPLQLEIAELIAFGGRRRLDAITVLGQEVGLAPPTGSVNANGIAGGPGDADTAAGGAGMAGDEGTAGNRAETAGGADTGRLFLVGDPQQSIYRFSRR